MDIDIIIDINIHVDIPSSILCLRNKQSNSTTTSNICAVNKVAQVIFIKK